MSPLRTLLSLTLAFCVALLLLAPAAAQPQPVEPDGGIGDGAGPPPGIDNEAEQVDQDKAETPEPNQTDQTDLLGGPDRYLTHLSTDKPIYRAGEKVYVRGTILHAFTNVPFGVIEAEQAQAAEQQVQDAGDDQVLQREAQQARRLAMAQQRVNPMVEIKDAKGATIAGGRTQVEDGVFGFMWEVPEGQAGGEYTIKVTYPFSGLAPAERTFDIRAYRAPRIRTQIDFIKDGYGPGDTVIATLEATRAEGGIPEGATITAIARVDGAEVARVVMTMPSTGVAEARFDLPAEIERGEGTLAFVIEDGGVVETASKTIPILLQTVDLQLYPEGGYLVAGVENRVYFEARTPFGKPADIKGFITGKTKEGLEPGYSAIWLFETTHEGRGVFSFTPQTNLIYSMHITEPSSVTEVFELPEILNQGLALTVAKPVISASESLEVAVRRNTDLTLGHCSVVVRQRERIVWPNDKAREAGAMAGTYQFPSVQGIAQPGVDLLLANFSIDLDSDVSGILTVTAYDQDNNPVAERLIYRAPKDRVNIEVLPDSAQYTPGGRVSLQIRTIDSAGEPVSAVAGLTVTDDSVLEMIETREQAPNLPAMVFLEPGVRELADAAVYLDPNNPDAAEQLDLLLGTQGWRRFALVDLNDFIREHGDDARRMLAFRVPVRAEQERLGRLQRGAPGGAELDGIAMPMRMAAAAGPAPAEEPEMAEDAAAAVDDAPAPPAQPQAPPMDAREEMQLALEEAAQNGADQALFAEDEDIAGDRVRRQMPQMVYVREYAHAQPEGKPFGERSDFTETVYWSATTKTNEQGLATVTFDLSDSVTSFRVKADAFTQGGALGAGTSLIESVRPFYIEPKLPLELTAGDKVLIPIAMVNNTDRDLPVELMIGNLGRAGWTTLDPIGLDAGQRDRTLHELTIGESYGDLAFNIRAKANGVFDENRRSLRVVPRGFPIDDGSGGMLQPDSQIEDELIIPETIVPGSLQASVTVYPTPMANLTEALEALIRDPYGCFEQTSSTTFPLVMAQQYFLSHQGIDPTLIATAQEKLDAGYKRLISFETEQHGYEWFGSTPPHEALTAYGLLEFVEMSKVMDVDQAMIQRTSDWLMSRVDENGSFKLDQKALDSFGRAPQDTTDAYIVWSLLEAGYDPAKIEKSIELVLKKATEGDDAYIIALGANIAQLVVEADTTPRWSEPHPQMLKAQELRKKLATKLNDEGFVEGSVTSITRSGGDALNIETTALAILAWLKDDAYTDQVEKSILWLTERCKAGQFGSTQSTVLALKAIVEYDKARSTPKAAGELILLVDGEPVGEPVAFTEDTKGAIKLPAIHQLLSPGKHTIGVLMDGGSKMPYSIAVEYHAETPASSEECKLRIETQVAPTLITSDVNHVVVGEGEIAEVVVKVTNITADGLPTPIAIVGIPGGLEPRYDQLKELVEAGTIASFEVIGRDVVLYWREMQPEQVVELSISCVAAVPGTYTGPASRAYLYYTNEHKQWADGLTVNITPRQAE